MHCLRKTGSSASFLSDQLRKRRMNQKSISALHAARCALHLLTRSFLHRQKCSAR
jgi:hypothetical protein